MWAPQPQQPAVPQAAAAFEVQGKMMQGQWTTGFCDCFDDPTNCCMTYFCPCITFGQIAEIVDRGSSSCGVSGALYGLICGLTSCQWIYSCAYRARMRAQYNLPEEPCSDCCVSCCCEVCALCQIHRELRNRGFDMNIGWHDNVQRQMGGAGIAGAPFVQGGMKR